MTKLQIWKADQWLPGFKDGSVWGKGGGRGGRSCGNGIVLYFDGGGGTGIHACDKMTQSNIHTLDEC